MNCIFMGTPLFGRYILEKLSKIVNIKLVLCQPDKPSGRNKRIENINFNIKFIEKRSSIINYLND